MTSLTGYNTKPSVYLCVTRRAICVNTCIIARTIASFPVMCSTDPVMALAARPIELPWISGLADADAAVAFAPPTADLAIGCPASAQGWLCGQFTHTTHLAGEKETRVSCSAASQTPEFKDQVCYHLFLFDIQNTNNVFLHITKNEPVEMFGMFSCEHFNLAARFRKRLWFGLE